MSKARDLANVATRSADLKAGTTAFFAMSTAPAGWIKANGANVSRTAYADLFTAIGTTYGAGDGSTTFKLPDLRGEFPRGFDDGRGVDSGRGIGSSQADEIKTHSHSTYGPLTPWYANYNGANGGPIMSGGTSNTSSVGGAETRPRNIALLACIKF